MSFSTIANKIPANKTGIEFLAASHFHIGKEPKWLSKQDPLAYKSTFQKDYPSRNIGKTGLSKIPPPAVMMHKDDQTRVQCSVTREQFIPKILADRDYSRNSLTKTNFKMDRDDRIETFRTTQDFYYSAYPLEDSHAATNPIEPMKSHIPQGTHNVINILYKTV